MAKYKIVSMNTTDGKRYILLRDFGGEWGVSRPTKYFKTKSGALREIKKRIKF